VTKRKLQRFAQNATFDNFFQPYYHEIIGGFRHKGNWNTGFFGNHNPLVVELGCGKGEFTIGLGRKYPDKNFIGIDVKGARMWRGAMTSFEENLKNVAFIRNQVEHIEHLFAPGEVDEIWITFPDPQIKNTTAKKRLTSPQFLNRYRKIAKNDTVVHLKTDNTGFFEYSLGVIRDQNLPLVYSSFDIYKSNDQEDDTSIQTYYENMFVAKGETIKYLRFILH